MHRWDRPPCNFNLGFLVRQNGMWVLQGGQVRRYCDGFPSPLAPYNQPIERPLLSFWQRGQRSSWGETSVWASMTAAEWKAKRPLGDFVARLMLFASWRPAGEPLLPSKKKKRGEVNWGSLYAVTQACTLDRKWDLGERVKQCRSAKYSSNFTPEWMKTWPSVSAGDSTNLTASI